MLVIVFGSLILPYISRHHKPLVVFDQCSPAKAEIQSGRLC